MKRETGSWFTILHGQRSQSEGVMRGFQTNLQVAVTLAVPVSALSRVAAAEIGLRRQEVQLVG